MTKELLKDGFVLLKKAKYEEALLKFDDVLAHESTSETAFFGKGEAYRNQNKQKAALRMYDKSIECKADNVKAYAFKALILKATNQETAAKEAYVRTTSMKASESYDYAGLGFMQLVFGNVTEAFHIYHVLISKDKSFALGYVLQGNAYDAVGKKSEAIESYKTAIRCDKNFAVAHCNLANVYLSVGLINDAKREYNCAIKINPKYALAHFHKGKIFASENNYSAAIRSYDKAIEFSTEFLAAVFHKGNLLLEYGKLEEALETFDQALSLAPNFAPARVQKIVVLERLGRVMEGEEAKKSFLEDAKIMHQIHYAAGNAFAQQGHKDAAIELYGKALDEKDDFFPAIVAKAILLQDKKDFDNAAEDYNQALRILEQIVEKDNSILVYMASCLNNLGDICRLRDKSDEAIAYLSRSLKIWRGILEDRPHQNIAICLNNLANAYAATEQFGMSAKLMLESLEIWQKLNKDQTHPSITHCMNNLGLIYLQSKDKSKALEYFEKALELKPNFNEAKVNKLSLLLELEQAKAASATFLTTTNPFVDDDTESLDSGLTVSTDTNQKDSRIKAWAIEVQDEAEESLEEVVYLATSRLESDNPKTTIVEAKRLLDLMQGSQIGDLEMKKFSEAIYSSLCALILSTDLNLIDEISDLMEPFIFSENDYLLDIAAKINREIKKHQVSVSDPYIEQLVLTFDMMKSLLESSEDRVQNIGCIQTTARLAEKISAKKIIKFLDMFMDWAGDENAYVREVSACILGELAKKASATHIQDISQILDKLSHDQTIQVQDAATNAISCVEARIGEISRPQEFSIFFMGDDLEGLKACSTNEDIGVFITQYIKKHGAKGADHPAIVLRLALSCAITLGEKHLWRKLLNM